MVHTPKSTPPPQVVVVQLGLLEYFLLKIPWYGIIIDQIQNLTFLKNSAKLLNVCTQSQLASLPLTTPRQGRAFKSKSFEGFYCSHLIMLYYYVSVNMNCNVKIKYIHPHFIEISSHFQPRKFQRPSLFSIFLKPMFARKYSCHPQKMDPWKDTKMKERIPW